MKAYWIACFGLVAMGMTACATNEVLQATGGSRSDGTVELSYDYGLFQRPVVNMAAAQSTAEARCRAWGYPSAEPFGGQMNHCEQSDLYGNCVKTLVTVKYQCTGTGAPR